MNHYTGEYIPFDVYSSLKSSPATHEVGLISNLDGTTSWGLGGAGLLVVTDDYKEVLLLERSNAVHDPKLWGISGGARKMFDNFTLECSLTTAVVESNEEMGSLLYGNIRENPVIYNNPLNKKTFETWILEIDTDEKKSFVPELNEEHEDWRYFKNYQLKDIDLHPGVDYVLKQIGFY